ASTSSSGVCGYSRGASWWLSAWCRSASLTALSSSCWLNAEFSEDCPAGGLNGLLLDGIAFPLGLCLRVGQGGVVDGVADHALAVDQVVENVLRPLGLRGHLLVSVHVEHVAGARDALGPALRRHGREVARLLRHLGADVGLDLGPRDEQA